MAIITGILCCPVLGEIEFGTEAGLIGQANPALAALDKLLVVIITPDAEPSKDALVFKELEAKVKNKLKKTGIKIKPEIAGNILNIPELRVYIDMLKLEEPQQYVFCIQTSLAGKVSLEKEPPLYIKADVWRTKAVMQSASLENMPGEITNVVLEQAEAFIHAYLVANPPATHGTEAETSETVLATVLVKQARPATKPATAEYKYVASKNSNVFHKPECSAAKRIKPENIIGYNNRGEAIKSGRRPCKRCKP